jgi:restriction endonuclease Mrr
VELPQTQEAVLQEALLKGELDNSLVGFLLSFGLNHIEPLKFEELILKVFEKYGFTGNLTPVTGDDGIDIFLYVNGLKGIAQCKRYSENQTISVKDIREFLGSMIHVDAQFGYFITTTSFSDQAREFSRGKQFHLIHGDMLKQIIIHAIALEFGALTKIDKIKLLSSIVQSNS